MSVSCSNCPLAVLVLVALAGSASYIAALAAIRASMPEANISLAMLASLGMAFPLNVLIGLLLHRVWVSALA